MVLDRSQFNGGVNDVLPPYCCEAEQGVLGCCLLDIAKTTAAVKAGVTPRWFYETRHAELFKVLCTMALNGGGDLLTATIALRERDKFEAIGVPPAVNSPAVPSIGVLGKVHTLSEMEQIEYPALVTDKVDPQAQGHR